MKQIFLVTLFLFVFLTFVFEAFAQQDIGIYPQPDAPLQISNVVPKWRTSKDNPNGQEFQMLSANFDLQNISDKKIYAYTVAIFEGNYDKSNPGFTSFAIGTNHNILLPNQSRSEEIGETGSSWKMQNIKIAVDYVEFNDGTAWGPDTSHSAQYIAGIRAGAKFGQYSLLKILKQNGIETVIKALDQVEDISPPENESVKWKSGFKYGTRRIKYAVKKAYEKQDSQAVDTTLQKQWYLAPID